MRYFAVALDGYIKEKKTGKKKAKSPPPEKKARADAERRREKRENQKPRVGIAEAPVF